MLPIILDAWDDTKLYDLLVRVLMFSSSAGWEVFFSHNLLENDIIPEIQDNTMGAELEADLWLLIGEVATWSRGRMQLSEYISRY